MIKSFRHKGLEDFFDEGSKRGIQPKHAQRLSDILDQLETAKIVQDLDLPNYDLHPLKGDLEGFWSVKISGNWRIVFRFEEGDAYEIDYLDYH